MRIGSLLVAALLVCGASGCVSPMAGFKLPRSAATRLPAARQAFASGDAATAHATLTQLSEKKNRFTDAAQLDLAMVELAAGDRRAAEQRLRKLRDRFDALPEVAPGREVAAIITDDTVRVFRPAGYEQVMIRAMLAVCSLAGDGSDAEAYALQAAMRQSELAQNASDRGILNSGELYQPIALAPYLRGILREATHHDYDDATRAYQLVSSLQPNFAPAIADIARASEGTHSAPGHGVLYVLACVGRGPVLTETTAPTTSAALQIASAVTNVQTNQTDSKSGGPALALGNIVAVKVPRVEVPASEIAAVGVRANGQLLGATQTLTDVGRLAAQQCEAEMPWTIARAVVRRVTKEAAVVHTRDTLGLGGAAGSLFHFAVASAWASTERADTRCWGLLPREIQVLRAELPRGSWQVQLQPLGYSGHPIAAGASRQLEIVDAKNHYLVVIAPNRAIYLVD